MVGRDDHGHPEPSAQLDQQGLDTAHVHRIQPRERFVAQHHLGIADQGPGEARPTDHPPRELTGIQGLGARKAHRFQALTHMLGDGGLREVRVLPQGKRDIVEDRHRIQQRTALEEHADPVADGEELGPRKMGDVVARDANAAAIGTLEPPDQTQDRALPSSASAEHDGDLSARKLAGEIPKHEASAQGETHSIERNLDALRTVLAHENPLKPRDPP